MQLLVREVITHSKLFHNFGVGNCQVVVQAAWWGVVVGWWCHGGG